jgi:hypothetical protein
MSSHTKVRRLVLVGAVAAAIAAPSAGAEAARFVQIGGDMVAPTQLSAYQANAGSPESAHKVQIAGRLVSPADVSKAEADAAPPVGAHLVQVGGKLVRPEGLSAYQAHTADVIGTNNSSSDDDGFGWTTTGLGIGLIGSLLLAAGVLGVLWRRGRLSTV